MDITICSPLPPELRAAAAQLYWQAFGGKLGRVLGPDALALGFLTRVIRSDHCLAAIDKDNRLVGLAGFKSIKGSFAGGTWADIRAAYGWPGALWRSLMLWTLSREVDNDRFLLDGICVDRDARGLGVGTALLKAIYAEAARRGYRSVRLDVVDTNWRARALYEREGFVATRTERMGMLAHVFGFAASTTMVKPLLAD